jgi:hypothetical protein
MFAAGQREPQPKSCWPMMVIRMALTRQAAFFGGLENAPACLSALIRASS